jgi:hypothetical protein
MSIPKVIIMRWSEEYFSTSFMEKLYKTAGFASQLFALSPIIYTLNLLNFSISLP